MPPGSTPSPPSTTRAWSSRWPSTGAPTPGAAPASTPGSPSSTGALSPASPSTRRPWPPDVGALLDAVIEMVPPRSAVTPVPGADLFGHTPAPPPATSRTTRKTAGEPAPKATHDWGPVAELAIETGPVGAQADTSAASTAGPYEPWRPSVVRVPGAIEHPTPLVQSGAMAAVPHPVPAYRPMLPERVIADGLLSDAQAESVVLARRGPCAPPLGQLPHRLGLGDRPAMRRAKLTTKPSTPPIVTDDGEVLSAPVRFRRGWMLGDGTGAGKGRQVAAIVLDNWLCGRRRALWLSQSDKLVEDARRDWTALGGRDEDVIPFGQVPPGGGDSALGRHPLRDLRDAALAGPPGQDLAARPDRRLACGLARRGRPPRIRRRHRLRRGARDGERGGVQGQPRRGRAVAAGPRGTAPPERAPRRAHRLRLGDRRHHRPRSRLRGAPRACGPPARRRSRSAPTSSARWRRAAWRHWRSSPAT